MPHSECVNVSPRANDEGCGATGWQDRFPARSTHSGRFSEIDEVDGVESDIPCRRPCLVSGHLGALLVTLLPVCQQLGRCTGNEMGPLEGMERLTSGRICHKELSTVNGLVQGTVATLFSKYARSRVSFEVPKQEFQRDGPTGSDKLSSLSAPSVA